MVNSLEDPGDGSCTNNQCTLREAIAVAQNGERITFKSNLMGKIALTAGELLIDQGVTVQGPGADKLIVSAEGLSRVFNIGSVNPAIVTISDLTITRGRPAAGAGGGIIVATGSRLVLIGSAVMGNSAGAGGGIFSTGSLTIVGSTIAANNASGGGGGLFSDGALSISRTTISGNDAGTSQGGGVVAVCNVDCPGGVTFRSSTITNNDAGNGGGGVILLGVQVTISNTIIAGNRTNGDPTASDADCSDSGNGVSLGYNLTSLGTGCLFTAPSDVILPLPSQVFTFVLFPVLAENGSSRKTHALIERGLAVDAGYCPGESGDQRGFPRPFDDLRMPNALDGCDIGAFEWQPADSKTKGPKK
jgi:CSLREA domain-containing protein